jgi:hypothetical protein
MIRHSSVQSPCECPFLGLLDATVAVETPFHAVFSAVVLTLDWMPPILVEEWRWRPVPVPARLGAVYFYAVLAAVLWNSIGRPIRADRAWVVAAIWEWI